MDRITLEELQRNIYYSNKYYDDEYEYRWAEDVICEKQESFFVVLQPDT